ncbi:type VII secretion target [Mycobacterium sp. NPDC006124]|uniref:type VII secretion target n=1 Tax=Mycobacterium sp. NPDC006124 TaxID=3156729 RepID=UPI0033A11450
MGGPFTLDGNGLAPLAQIHSQVASGLSQLTGPGGPQAADVAKSFGNIASSVNDALDGVTQSRGNTLQATKGSSDTIAELLGKADQMYAAGDEEGAAKLRAAAEALEGPGGAAAAGGAAGPGAAAGGAGAGAAGGGGAEMAGQMASQVGQQVGQLAQGMAQSVQGLAQGLTQLPQQIMQGIQSMAGSAGKGTDAEALAKAAEEKTGTDEDRDADEREREEDAAKRAEEERAQQRPPAWADGAQPGRTTESGPAPVAPPAPERPQPAQTRPQQFSL